MELERFDSSGEIIMRTQRPDGSWSSRPIWVVVVDESAYVRSAYGDRGAWYRLVRSGADAQITVDGETVAVSLVPVDDEELNDRISDAYRRKYGAAWPGPAENMSVDEARATTMRVEPADDDA